jgi:3-dehydroquinate synthetase
LPTHLPANLDRKALLRAMAVDKKRQQGKSSFALPVRIGEVQSGVLVEEEGIWSLLSSYTALT